MLFIVLDTIWYMYCNVQALRCHTSHKQEWHRLLIIFCNLNQRNKFNQRRYEFYGFDLATLVRDLLSALHTPHIVDYFQTGIKRLNILWTYSQVASYHFLTISWGLVSWMPYDTLICHMRISSKAYDLRDSTCILYYSRLVSVLYGDRLWFYTTVH